MIICGDAREKLDELYQQRGEFVHAVITSPPYWGLRDYSDAVECVFGGDESCEHQFEGEVVHEHREEPTHAKSRTTDRFYGSDETRCFTGNHQKHVSNQFCVKCQAWRGQFGLEPTPEMYIEHTLEFLRAIRRVLRPDGTVWWNLGDSYAGRMKGMGKDKCFAGPKQSTNPGSVGLYVPDWNAIDLKPKDLVMIPFRVALAAQADGWWVRSVIIWNKPNPMPESVRDRPTTSHEYVLLLTKSARYFYDADAIREVGPEWLGQAGTFARSGGKATSLEVPGQGHVSHRADRNDRVPSGRNKRTIWTIATQPYPEAHFATFPEALVEPMILTTPTKCCAECGAGWERVTEVYGGTIGKAWHDHVDDGIRGQRTINEASRGHGYTRNSLGFRPTCSCDAETKPAVVVDPFAGKGTVAKGCRKNNRDWIMIEMNPDYIPMMERYLAMADEEVEKQGETWVQKRLITV